MYAIDPLLLAIILADRRATCSVPEQARAPHPHERAGAGECRRPFRGRLCSAVASQSASERLGLSAGPRGRSRGRATR